MTKAAAKHEPELFGAPTEKHPKVPALTEGKNRKGGRNPTTQIKDRPSAPGAILKKQEVVAHQPQSLMEVIAQAAMNPQVDVQKMKELLALKRDIEREEKEKLFNEALAAVKAELPPTIAADSLNKHTRSWWARYEKVSKVIDPIVRKHGLNVSFPGMGESPISDHYRVLCDVTHVASGFTKRYFLDGPSDAAGAKGGGSKTPIQGVASTTSYLQRILKCLIFDVVIEKVDRDGNAPEGESITEDQGDELLRLCAEKNIDRDTFQTAFRVNDIYTLPARKFDEAKAKLEMAPKREPKKGARDAADSTDG